MSTLSTTASGIQDFFWTARQRYEIKLRREAGEPAPWTGDWVFRSYRFCNVFREDDRVTRWLREHVRGPLRHSRHVLWAIIVHRWFNRIESMEVLNDSALGISRGEFHPQQMRERLLFTLPKGPWVTGAYMIKTPAGMDKIDGLLWCLGQIHPDVEHLAVRMYEEGTTLEGVWDVLRRYPYLGDFMAYEVVTDLRHTDLLCDAPDIMLWANPGPGAARGFARVLGQPIDTFNRHKQEDRHTLINGMQRLLHLSGDPTLWPAEWPRWEMREVEHWLCEFDKYKRTRNSEGRPKSRFQGR